MSPRSFAHSLVVVAVASLVMAISGVSPPARAGDPPAKSAPATELLSIPNARIPVDGVLSGGQPTLEQVEAAADAGFRTVINLRSDREKGFEWEREAVEDLGMSYIAIPVAGDDDLNRETVEQLDAALNGAISEGPVLLHCASGNRIGALLALRAAWLYDAEVDAALKYGQENGLTRLEPKIRELLGFEAAESGE